MNAPNGTVYRIVQSKQALDRLQELYQMARAEGSSSQCAAAVRQILARLQMNPLRFSEPRFSLPHAGLEIRACAEVPLMAEYGVHRERRIVFIRDFAPLPEPEL